MSRDYWDYAAVLYMVIYILIFTVILFIAGLVFGIFAYRSDIPPRWFWSKSKNQIFSFIITTVLGYAWNFAMWPCAIYLVYTIVKMV